MTEKKRPTAAQIERQETREASGRYDRMNPCYCCDVSVGADYYSTMHSDISFKDAAGKDQNFADAGLVLDATCSAMLDALPIAEAFALLMQPLEVRKAAKRKFAADQRKKGGKA